MRACITACSRHRLTHGFQLPCTSLLPLARPQLCSPLRPARPHPLPCGLPTSCGMSVWNMESSGSSSGPPTLTALRGRLCRPAPPRGSALPGRLLRDPAVPGLEPPALPPASTTFPAVYSSAPGGGGPPTRLKAE